MCFIKTSLERQNFLLSFQLFHPHFCTLCKGRSSARSTQCGAERGIFSLPCQSFILHPLQRGLDCGRAMRGRNGGFLQISRIKPCSLKRKKMDPSLYFRYSIRNFAPFAKGDCLREARSAERRGGFFLLTRCFPL